MTVMDLVSSEMEGRVIMSNRDETRHSVEIRLEKFRSGWRVSWLSKGRESKQARLAWDQAVTIFKNAIDGKFRAGYYLASVERFTH